MDDAVQWTVLGLLTSAVLLTVTLMYRRDMKRKERNRP